MYRKAGFVMKRKMVLCFVVILLVVASCCLVCAENGSIDKLPQKVVDILAEKGVSRQSLEDYVVVDQVAHTGFSHLFVLASKDGTHHIVYHFTNSESDENSHLHWEYKTSYDSLAPQGKGPVCFYRHEHYDRYGENGNVQLYDNPDGFMIYRINPQNQEEYIQGVNVHVIDKQFQIVAWFDMTSSPVCSAYIKNRTLHYGDNANGKSYGTVTLYRTFDLTTSFSSLPKTYKKAAEKYTDPASIPSGELEAELVKFASNKTYAVYSAPDKISYRASNGKAKVSTNDWIQVFGQEGDWILIQYAIDSDHYRFGYIDKKSLPKKADVPGLGFDRNVVYIANDVFVTDDPLYSRASIATLQEGTSVTLLARMGEDAYIEGQTNGETFRGFVPLQAITAEKNRFATYTDENGKTFNLFSVTRLNMDDNHHVESVTGMYERIVYGEECVEPDEAPESKVTYRLAENFHAEMINSMTEPEMHNVPVTDLYQWYIDAYIGRDHYDGHDFIFCDDLTEEQMEMVNPDFWFIETKIRLNEQNEIEYMEYVSVPWA